MRIGVIGINFKSADLLLREKMAKACKHSFAERCFFVSDYPCVLLSTCNRTEIYFSAQDLAEAHSYLLSLLRDQIDIAFEHNLYSFFGQECFGHLAKVTAGLDSAILAETEIQKQVKLAYENACLNQCLSSSLHFLFQKSLKIGKWVRTHASLPQGQIRLERILFEVSRHIFEELKDISLFFVGNSEINRKLLFYFRTKGVEKITLCTRSPDAAVSLRETIPLEIVRASELSRWQDHDLVICGTTTHHDYLLTPSHLDASRPVKNQMIFDLSVPRNVDPALKKDPRIHLLNIEEIGHIIEKKQNTYSKKMEEIEDLVRSLAEKQFFHYLQKEQRKLISA